MKTRILCAALAATAAAGCVYHREVVRPRPDDMAQSSAGALAESAAGIQPAALMQSEQFVIHSKIVDGDFLIQVAKPLGGAPPGAKLPVVYVLDGTHFFGLTAPAARLLTFARTTQPSYVVGIGFPEEALPAYMARRNRDLLHTAGNAQTIGGGGAAFERFIKEELRPLIEARYPVDPQRSVLAGHSLGGLFAATVLANEPGAFAGYMIGSPSLQFDAGLAERVRTVAASGNAGRVYIGVGANEGPMVGRADALEQALRAEGSRYTVLRRTHAEESHVSVLGPWMWTGLQHVLPPQT
jgi:predicted alpha/beta superfamily hydrolase